MAQEHSHTPSKWMKDVKFGGIVFVFISYVIGHWVWIMRQLILYPDLTSSTVMLYFFSLFVGIGVLGYGFVGAAYPRIYAQELAQEKEAIKQREIKKSQ